MSILLILILVFIAILLNINEAKKETNVPMRRAGKKEWKPMQFDGYMDD